MAKFTDAQWKFLFDLWCKGYSMGELCEWVDKSKNTFRYHFIRLGLIFNPKETTKPLSTYNEKFKSLGRR